MSTIEKAIGKLGRSDKSTPDVPVVDDAQDEVVDAHPGQGVPPQRSQVSSSMDASTTNRVMLDLARLERMGFLTPESARGQLTEEIRHLKRPLLLNAFRRGLSPVENSNLIMVSSSRPGEGKTFTSINLAMSIAKERGKTVLLVDADVARPSVSKTLGIDPKKKGLVDYLVDESLSLPDILLKTNVPNLRILPSGRRHIHSTELLASDAMRQLVEELALRYPDRVVIFDSPPLLATTEAAILAGLIGQIVLVVEAEKTTKQEVNEALGLLDDSKMIGLMLNKTRAIFSSDNYGYYGYYGSASD